jgi:hypothetical protein
MLNHIHFPWHLFLQSSITYEVLVKSFRERNNLGELGIDGKINWLRTG